MVGPTEITVQLPAALLANGQTAGIVVRNPEPDGRISMPVAFEVQAFNRPLFLPLARR